MSADDHGHRTITVAPGPRPERNGSTLRSDPRRSPRWGVELAVVAVLYGVYDTTRGLRNGNLATAEGHGSTILRWERTLHLDPEHALNQLLWHDRVLAVLASYDYAALHFIVTPAVLIWMYRRHPGDYRLARTALVAATVMALVVYWYLPTAPPRLLPGDAFHDILASVHGWGWWSSEGSAPRGLGSLTNQLAAMPSLHVGWALWSGWLIARHAQRPAVRVIGALYPISTALVVMGTGNHYLFDTLAGAGVILVGVVVARSLGGLAVIPSRGRVALLSGTAVSLAGESRGRVAPLSGTAVSLAGDPGGLRVASRADTLSRVDVGPASQGRNLAGTALRRRPRRPSRVAPHRSGPCAARRRQAPNAGSSPVH